MYILYVLTNGAPWPSDGGRKRPVQKPAWPRGQPRKRRLKDPDDVGAARNPFPCVREQFLFLFFFSFFFPPPFQSDRGLCLSQGTRSRCLFQKRGSYSPRASRLAPFFVKHAEARGDPHTHTLDDERNEKRNDSRRLRSHTKQKKRNERNETGERVRQKKGNKDAEAKAGKRSEINR